MAGGGVESGEQYSGALGFIYVFNLVVGFGALTLPHVFFLAGYGLGSLFLMALGCISYITATFIVECMSIGNAVEFLELHKHEKYHLVGVSSSIELRNLSSNDAVVQLESRSGNRSNLVSRKPLTSSSSSTVTDDTSEQDLFEAKLRQDPFELRQKLELGDMAKIFLGSKGYKVLVGITAVYLYGDLAIYASATPTTLVTLFPGQSDKLSVPWLDEPMELDKSTAYNLWLVIFALIVVPLSCLNFQKTKHLQIFTCTYRNLAIFAMIILASLRYINEIRPASLGTAQGFVQVENIPVSDLQAIPKLFGAATYSFMCHHSIPSIVFPIEPVARKRTVWIIGADYLAILVCYLCLCITAVLAFGIWKEEKCLTEPNGLTCSIQRIYILNFNTASNPFFGDFLTLLPVFICFTNYPLIAITTRNNLSKWFSLFEDRVKGVFFSPAASSCSAPLPSTPSGASVSRSGGGGTGASGDSASSSPTLSLSEETASVMKVPASTNQSQEGVGLLGKKNQSKSLKDPARSNNAPPVKLWHSLVVAIPPIFIAYVIPDVSIIVEFTGSYAGLALEFLFPCWLIVSARKQILSTVDLQAQRNPYQSPFQSNSWVQLVLAWSVASLCFIFVQQMHGHGQPLNPLYNATTANTTIL